MSLRRNISCQHTGAPAVGNGTPVAAQRQASESDDQAAPPAKRIYIATDAVEALDASDETVRIAVDVPRLSATSAAPKSGDGNSAAAHKGSDYSATFGPVIRLPDSTSVGFE